MKKKHPKIEKNIYDLKYNSSLQTLHTLINLGFALWFVLIGGMLAWLIGGKGGITNGLIIFFMTSTSVLFTSIVIFCIPIKLKQKNLLNLIEKLDAKRL